MAPTQEQIRLMFEPLSQQGQQSQFFDSVVDDVRWTILGHSPMSKTFTNKSEFVSATLTVLRDRVLSEPLRLSVFQVSGGGSSGEWATVEMQAVDAKCKNGLTYDMNYCWVCHFNHDNKIDQVRAYIDTKLLTDAIEQNQ